MALLDGVPKTSIDSDLERWQIRLAGEWTADETARIHKIFGLLDKLSGDAGVSKLFNDQVTTFHHSQRPGRVGRTIGSDIYLDNDWTDWTMAHELGHRWNNAWSRNPEHTLRSRLGAGRIEWLKRFIKRFEKWLSRMLNILGIKTRIDWKALWYHPGSAPPPCGIDRNFNASEDLAESFAATIFPEDAKQRASNAAKRVIQKAINWDWGKDFSAFHETPRGQVVLKLIRHHSSSKQNADQPDNRTA